MELEAIMMDAGMTVPPREKLKGWLAKRRQKLGITPVEDITLSKLRTVIDEFRTKTDWESKDEDRPLLLDVPDLRYIITGADVSGHNPKTTKHGTSYAYICPMATPRMLRNLVHARNVELKTFERVSVREGPAMSQILSQGFLEIDGVYKLISADEGVVSCWHRDSNRTIQSSCVWSVQW